MKKKFLLFSTIVSSVLLASTNPESAFAQSMNELNVGQSTVLQITGVYESTDGYMNYKNFEVSAPATGHYYAGAWLLPAMLADGDYTSFQVYVNGDFVETITPTCGNWQSVSLDNHFNLTAGVNTISIATPMPDFPSVETIKIAQNEEDVAFSTDAYDYFLAESSIDNIEDNYEGEAVLYSTNQNFTNNNVFLNVPLRYTFYKIITFVKDHDITITSSSTSHHNIDVFYYSFGIASLGDDFLSTGVTKHGTLNKDGSNTIITPIQIYTRPSAEEMQGLNWMAPSESPTILSKKTAKLRMTVPKTGLYLIRVRNAGTFGTALVDLNLNDKYFYQDLPISYDYVDITIPADYWDYATIVNGNNPNQDDPMVFIHGNDADRVVGFNDNALSSEQNEYNLSSWDSFLNQIYFVRTTRISVSNSSSSNPNSKCTITVGRPYNIKESIPKMKSKVESDTDENNFLNSDESVYLTKTANINGNLDINSLENINRVTAYNTSGSRLGIARCNEPNVSIPVSTLNIRHRGIYIINIETDNTSVSKKINIQ